MAFYDDVHTRKRFRLGTVKYDIAGNEYMYCAGASSTVATDAVAIDENFATTRLLQATIGQVAVAKAAVDATTKFGWYQTGGSATVKVATGFAADQAGCYSTGTAGTIDDSGAGGEEFIFGMLSRTAISSGTATVQMISPCWKGAATLD